MQQKLHFLLKRYWGIIILCIILLTIIVLNIKPGYLVLGNDNFSPELNPSLTLDRSLFSPGWRAYRALGIPSDSEQADIFRSLLYLLVGKALPVWVISQGYLLFTFMIASISMGQFVSLLAKRLFHNKFSQLSILLGGLFYTCSMLTLWIYFFPVHLFIAAYAFLPLVLWRLACFFEKVSIRNSILLLVATLLLTTSALTATMFIICAGVLIIFIFIYSLLYKDKLQGRIPTVILSAVFITLAVHSFWFLPFFTYVRSNTQALRDSAINQKITTTTIENEAKYNTALNVPRYFASWIDTKEDASNFTFAYRDWYVNSPFATGLSFLPILFAVFGWVYLFQRRDRILAIIPLMAIAGWYFIKGINPPFGFIIEYVQQNFPVIAQVFRWQSSKLWPLLAVSIPFLAVVGVLSITEFLQKSIQAKKVLVFFLFLVISSLLIFIYPVFLGQLSRDKVFVKVPQEYFDLKNYLEKTDSFSRIYLAPEANSLYFRNYSWGFWGSVVLNYIIPNPIIEKALIIGSYESEQAFTLLTNAYYSENQKSLTQALMRFNTPYVLSDKYVSRGDVGYPYNWDIHANIVENNPDFEKVWEKGKLSLYKIKNYQNIKSKDAISINSQTDYKRLNSIFLSIGDSRSYYSSQKDRGIIYPFALSYDSLSFTNNELVGKLKYKGEDDKFNFTIEPSQLLESPSQILFDQINSELLFYPLLPNIQVNDLKYIYQKLPVTRFKVEVPPSFITVNDEVIDMSHGKQKLTAANTYYQEIGKTANIKSWTSSLGIINLLDNNSQSTLFCNNSRNSLNIILSNINPLKCGSSEVTLKNDTIAKVDIEIESSSAIQAVLCIESSFKKRCENQDVNGLLTKEGTLKASLFIPYVFEKEDKIKVFLDFRTKEKESSVSVKKLYLELYEQSQIPKLKKAELPTEPLSFSVPVRTNDEIALHIPLYEGTGSWTLKKEGNFIPEVSLSPAGSSTTGDNQILINENGSISFVTKEAVSSMYPKLNLVDGRKGLGLIAFSGINTSGIPLELSIRKPQEERKVFEEIFPSKKETNKFDIFILPHQARSYNLEALSTGIGPRASKNTLNNLVFQLIPKSWYEMKLNPQKEDTKTIIELKPERSKETNTYKGLVGGKPSVIAAIPTANSSNWKLSINGEVQKNEVKINGWQQGWIVDKSGEGKVEFLPNRLVYIGFIPLILVIFILLFLSAKTQLLGYQGRKVSQSGNAQKDAQLPFQEEGLPQKADRELL